MTGLTLDTGALLAVERREESVRALLRRAERLDWPVHVPAGVVAQAWRGGPRQALVAKLIFSSAVTIVPLDAVAALEVGVRCAESGHPDVVDVHVAVHAAREGHRVVTSDPRDISRVDPSVEIIAL